jgi:hypothetical protein
MNDNQLISLDDAALDEVNGGATLSITFPSPKELVSTAVSAVGSVVEAGVGAANSFLKLFGIKLS